MLCIVLFFFFFFQAEDGIRDWSVTGVQTCALPISPGGVKASGKDLPCFDMPALADLTLTDDEGRDVALRDLRSEERRVGKECRSRWAEEHTKKKRRSETRTTLQTKSARWTRMTTHR